MRDCFADVVDDATRDHGTRREREVDVLEHGTFRELQWAPSFEWPPLPVRDIDEPPSCRLQLVAAGWEFRELISAFRVRCGRGRSGAVSGVPLIHADVCASQRFARIGADDATANHACSRASSCRPIP
jgi:hypothetical protein